MQYTHLPFFSILVNINFGGKKEKEKDYFKWKPGFITCSEEKSYRIISSCHWGKIGAGQTMRVAPETIGDSVTCISSEHI